MIAKLCRVSARRGTQSTEIEVVALFAHLVDV